MRLTGRRMLLFGTFVLAALAFLYFVLPQLGGVKHTWDRLNEGDAWWIAVAVIVEVVSMASYIAIFQGVHVPKGSPIRWRHSYQITMAGLAATRLFAAGGAGGVAVTAWSLRRSGMESREVAQRMIAFLVLLYGVYMAALVVCGVGLYTGVFPGPHPFAITIVPAIVGAVGLVAIFALAFVPRDLEQRLSQLERRRESRIGRRVVHLLGGLRRPRQRRRMGRASPCRSCVTRNGRCSGYSRGGASTSPCCTRHSAPSVRRRRWRCWWRHTSWGCLPICCRCPAASVGWTAG